MEGELFFTIAVSADGREVQIIGPGPFLRRWDAATGAPLAGEPYRLDTPTMWAERTPDGRYLALTGESDTMDLVDVGANRRVRSITVPGARALTRPAFSPDGRLVALGTFQGEIAIAEVRTGQLRRRWLAAAGPTR